MTTVKLDITMSLDGFVAGPDATLEEPLGRDGERLHEWIFGLAGWRERHGLEGGSTGPDDELMTEGFLSVGAFVMGRRMFDGGSGPWEDDPNADGWWQDEPPFHAPVFVVTHHPREPLVKGETTFFFVDGVEPAVEQARAAAGGKDVGVGGGASVAQQLLRAGLLGELHLHIVPLLLGGGVRLFGGERPELELTRTVASPNVTHLRYRVRDGKEPH